ncbi:peptidase C39 family protein [Saccharomonospora piscinae]|uniref:C39 family peptidase n=1 Tax=Saccharomonospora piscinae TaxID=687388 RepID=UPI0011063299|nr:C39 family peptidase [Saccharomonospora piscinae]TLW94475.1 peptidase C39 family protein [Saccharomonospora piscinae]
MRRSLTSFALSAATVAATLTPAAAASPGEEEIDYHEWSGVSAFHDGATDGVAATGKGLRLSRPPGSTDTGTWLSPWYSPGFDATELITSWNATTPDGTWLKIEVTARTGSGDRTPWYTLGTWAYGDGDIERTTTPGQSDEHAAVYVDTLAANDGVAFRSYQVRVTLHGDEDTGATPVVRAVGAMTSTVPDRFEVPTSAPGAARGTELAVPRYAQNVHSGHYPEYGGGGQSWCSPTSTEMVVEYWGRGPDEQDLAWLPDDYVDPTVAHAARHTYDYAYEGTGNWPFNTAYAAHYGLRGHVTRLHSLAELENYIARGVPVITSVSFLESELDGAGYGTDGHLMVVIGFTAEGDVIVNDPASDSNEQVRRVYHRDQFETVWQRTLRHTADGALAGGPGGIAYVIRP